MWHKLVPVCLLVLGAVVAALSDWQHQPVVRLFPSALQEDDMNDWRTKRTGPSLSVSNPIEVLRNRLLLEIARRRLQKQEGQVSHNREFLKNIGKRHTMDNTRTDNFDYFSNSGELNWES